MRAHTFTVTRSIRWLHLPSPLPPCTACSILLWTAFAVHPSGAREKQTETVSQQQADLILPNPRSEGRTVSLLCVPNYFPPHFWGVYAKALQNTALQEGCEQNNTPLETRGWSNGTVRIYFVLLLLLPLHCLRSFTLSVWVYFWPPDGLQEGIPCWNVPLLCKHFRTC